MLYGWITGAKEAWLAPLGIFFVFGATAAVLAKLGEILPRDGGREYAHDGKLSAGKPRGAGVLFVPVFAAAAFLFAPMDGERIIYLILLLLCMLTGFLDDASETPWGEYKKGFLDLCVAALAAMTYLRYNGNVVSLAFADRQMELPPALFAVLAVILVWGSVNVTNCADGVDGLSATVAIVTLTTVYLADRLLQTPGDFSYLILLFVMCLLGYLWFNAAPSKLMMGDAGSRAMGLFIAIAVLKSGSPFLYIPAALVLILDGGLGLVKVFLLRFFKIRILKNIRTPLHDHVRKVWGWSDTQTVFRFAILQILLSAAVVCGLTLV